ncbi:hypothetical protein L6452_23425 [Arctium lappa]|uniref:Uncharacterized protein n=1 Tax=Arctium lappa TaxID=4217 RepID=A0ACB9B144_ARCLA|nr:hypothetical protein L6452_23425 [Arctium lappa]
MGPQVHESRAIIYQFMEVDDFTIENQADSRGTLHVSAIGNLKDAMVVLTCHVDRSILLYISAMAFILTPYCGTALTTWTFGVVCGATARQVARKETDWVRLPGNGSRHQTEA